MPLLLRISLLGTVWRHLEFFDPDQSDVRFGTIGLKQRQSQKVIRYKSPTARCVNGIFRNGKEISYPSNTSRAQLLGM